MIKFDNFELKMISCLSVMFYLYSLGYGYEADKFDLEVRWNITSMPLIKQYIKDTFPTKPFITTVLRILSGQMLYWDSGYSRIFYGYPLYGRFERFAEEKGTSKGFIYLMY